MRKTYKSQENTIICFLSHGKNAISVGIYP